MQCSAIMRKNEESEQAYEAFKIYIELGNQRSIQAVADKLQKSYTLIKRWKDRWNWKDRALEYDNKIEMEAQSAVIAERKKMIRRHIKLAMAMERKASKALKNMSEDEMSAKDIKEFVKVATELERMNRFLDDKSTAALEDNDRSEFIDALNGMAGEVWKDKDSEEDNNDEQE